MPGWEDAIAVVARVFHFSPESLWALDVDELIFWTERANWINERHG